MAHVNNTKHNKWMTILQAVFSALASLFGTIKITKSDNSENTDPPTDEPKAL